MPSEFPRESNLDTISIDGESFSHKFEYREAVSISLNNFSIELDDQTLSGRANQIINNASKNPLNFSSYFKPNKKKQVIQPITTVIPGGKLTAILGGSGCGKTTLLNVIANRYNKRVFHTKGDLKVSREIHSLGYVTQQDYLLPLLTVYETLLFTIKLKLDEEKLNLLFQEKNISIENLTTEMKYDILINSIVMDLGLKECVNTRIGNETVRGLSGGEKRRVSVGLQIISDPEILCADEPTSGLDSFTAITVIESLKKLTLSTRKTTIICSIHQPRADIFNIFDHILLLSKGGYSIYLGSKDNIVNYFSRLGFDCPLDANPADFFVDISSVEFDTNESDNSGLSINHSKSRINFLIKSFKSYNENQLLNFQGSSYQHSLESCINNFNSKNQMPISKQIYYLSQRFISNNMRNSSQIKGCIIQSICLGMILFGIFYGLNSSNLVDLQTIPGLLYMVISMEYYIMVLIMVENYIKEVKIMDRELQDNLYTPFSFLTSHIIITFPLLLLQPILYSVPLYFGSNLRPGGIYTFTFILVNIVLALVMNGLGWMSIAISREFASASMVSNLTFTFISLTSGFLVNFGTIPPYVSWIKYISVLSYSFKILMNNEFYDRTIEICRNLPFESNTLSTFFSSFFSKSLLESPSVSADNLQLCRNIEGESILDSYDVEPNDNVGTWLPLLAILAGYYIIAYSLFHFVRYPPIDSAGISSMENEEDENEDYIVEGIEAKNPILAQNSLETSLIEKDVVDDSLTFYEEEGYSPEPPNPNEKYSSYEIEIKDVSLFIKKKQILNDISIKINHSRLVAIMGGSGSGKTTLLNLISNRIAHDCLSKGDIKEYKDDFNTKINDFFKSDNSQYYGSGTIMFNNETLKSNQLRKIIGYVEQFDYHIANLTVKETLDFYAKLSLPSTSSKEKNDELISKILNLLGLYGVQHVRVGDENMKGISGGEKRRLSIAIQLLNEPSICLFDEPTTGLDSFTARHIVQLLRKLSRSVITTTNSNNVVVKKRRTMLLTIHQPRYDIYSLLDDIILLSRGKLVWSGPVDKMIKHFNSLNYHCPSLSNPADFILDISSIDFRSEAAEAESKDRLTILINSFKNHNKENLLKNDEEIISSTTNTLISTNTISNDDLYLPPEKSFFFLIKILFNREFIFLGREVSIWQARIGQAVFFLLILAAFYAPTKHDQASIQNRIGNLYELTALCFVGMLGCISIYPSQLKIFLYEYKNNYYSSYLFSMCYLFYIIPFILISCILISIVLVFFIEIKNTNEDNNAFIVFVLVNSCILYIGECLGVIFCSAFKNVGFSINIVSVVISLFCISSGFITLTMPKFFFDLGYISPLKYSSFILANKVFDNENFTCDIDDIKTGYCFRTGDQVLSFYSLKPNEDGNPSMTFFVLMLIFMTFFYFITAVLFVRFRAYKTSH